MTIADVVEALSQRKVQAALASLDAVCGDCPEPICVSDPRACPVSDARRSLSQIFLADWVESEPMPAAGGGCGSGGCGSGGCGPR